LALWGLLAVLLFLATKHYLGYYFFARYEKIREGAESIEQIFPVLERQLKSAAWYSNQPKFYRELGRLYFERAWSENQFGTPEKRDFFCGRAVEALREQIRRNPADADGYYHIGLVFLLYNYPLMTYRDQGRAFLRRAVELHPADEFISMNVCAMFIAHWDELGDGDKRLVWQQLKRDRYERATFLKKIMEKVVESLGSDEKFKEVLKLDPELWEEVKKYFQ
jgi:hypothetical protein